MHTYMQVATVHDGNEMDEEDAPSVSTACATAGTSDAGERLGTTGSWRADTKSFDGDREQKEGMMDAEYVDAGADGDGMYDGGIEGDIDQSDNTGDVDAMQLVIKLGIRHCAGLSDVSACSCLMWRV